MTNKIIRITTEVLDLSLKHEEFSSEDRYEIDPDYVRNVTTLNYCDIDKADVYEEANEIAACINSVARAGR